MSFFAVRRRWWLLIMDADSLFWLNHGSGWALHLNSRSRGCKTEGSGGEDRQSFFTSARSHQIGSRTLQSCFICTLKMGNKVLCRALWSSYIIFTSVKSWCIYLVPLMGWQSAKALVSIYRDLPLASSWSSALSHGSLANTLVGVLAQAFRYAFRSYCVPQDSIDNLESAASL